MIKAVLLLAVLGLVAWLLFRPRRTPEQRALTEARAVLGVGLRADAEAIRAAHRRLLAEAHPDRGGSPELANRVNVARDTLVAEMNRRTPRAS